MSKFIGYEENIHQAEDKHMRIHEDMKNIKIEQGNNNHTWKEGNRILKKPLKERIRHEQSYENQVKQWNNYYKNTEYNSAYLREDGALSTPYIEGNYPNEYQRLVILKTMQSQNFIMVDCKDPRNFITKDNTAYPIDFGQIYDRSYKYYNASIGLFLQEIKSLEQKLNGLIDKYENKISDLNKLINDIEKYKNKKLTSVDKKTSNKREQIESFIENTRERIKNFQDGNIEAFANYVKENKKAIKILVMIQKN